VCNVSSTTLLYSVLFLLFYYYYLYSFLFQDGIASRQYNGLIDVYTKTLKSDGIGGLYRGFVISCVGIFVYRGFYFGLYDTLKPMLLGEDAGLLLSFCLGYTVTVTAGLMSYPIDTIRRRMMMTSGQAVKYKGSIDCAKTVSCFSVNHIYSFFLHFSYFLAYFVRTSQLPPASHYLP